MILFARVSKVEFVFFTRRISRSICCSFSCSSINALSIDSLIASCLRSSICIPSIEKLDSLHINIRDEKGQYKSIYLLFFFKPGLEYSSVGFFRIEFKNDRRNVLTILTLVLLACHESHVGINSDAHAYGTCFESHGSCWGYSFNIACIHTR